MGDTKLFLTALSCDAKISTEGVFEVTSNNAPAVLTTLGPGRVLVDLDDKPRPLPLTIKLASKFHHHFDISGDFEYQGEGELIIKNAPKEFQHPRAVYDEDPATSKPTNISVMLNIFLSRVCDATGTVVTTLQTVPKGMRLPKDPRCGKPYPITDDLPSSTKNTNPWIVGWQTPPLSGINYADVPVFDGGDLKFSKKDVGGNTLDLVLQVQSEKGPISVCGQAPNLHGSQVAPLLIGVSWPKALRRESDSSPVPYLIYLHPHMGQNVDCGFYEGNGQQPYPFGWDYLFYGLWKYMNYEGDPLQSPFSKGLPYQIAASAKNVVLVIPLNKSGIEAGAFLRANQTEQLLCEINGFMFRQNEVYKPPPLGRIALAGFSGGVVLQENLLDSVLKTPGKLTTLKEVYMFDVHAGGQENPTAQNSQVKEAVNAAATWAAKDPNNVVRFYSQVQSSHVNNYSKLVGKTPPDGASVTEQGNRSVSIFPSNVWAKATGQKVDGQTIHQLISATMLTDALRKSKF